MRPRNGPPEAVSTSESTCSGARPSRHWKSAECSLSTGSSRAWVALGAAVTSSPAATRLSLFASASVTPRSSAQSVAGRPAKPTTAFRTRSGSARSSSSVRSPPTWVSGARPSIGVEPDAAATSSSSGCASTISTAWRPIEPVAPRSAIRASSRAHQCTAAPNALSNQDHVESTRRPRRRAARRSGRACRRGRRAAGPSPSPAGRA